MCWNAPVSLFFAVVGFASTFILIKKGRQAEINPSSTLYKPAAKYHALIVGNIAVVELCEFFIWLDAMPFSDRKILEFCPMVNQLGTYGVYLFGFVNWPWIIGTWAYFSSNHGNDKQTFKMLCLHP